MKLIKTIGLVCLAWLSCYASAKTNDAANLFSRSAEFSQVKISPAGDYLSVITKKDGKDMLLILKAADRSYVHAIFFNGNAQVGHYEWVNDERLVMQKEYLKGWSDHPLYYGELMAVNADGSRATYLFGYQGGEQQTGTNLRKNTPIRATAYILDPLPEDDRYMLVQALPWGNGGSNMAENTQKVYRVDVYKGRRKKVATAPITYPNFLTDHDGTVRYALSVAPEITSTLNYTTEMTETGQILIS